MRRTQFLTRPAYALALALASFGAAGLVATPAQAEKKDDKKGGAAKAPQPTKAFIPAYTEVKTLLDAAGKRPDVLAAKAKVSETERAYRSTRGRAAQEAARGQYDAAVAALAGLLTAEKAKTDELFTKVGNDADKFFAGQLTFTYGGMAVDKAMQRRGLVAMIDSGNGSFSITRSSLPAPTMRLKKSLILIPSTTPGGKRTPSLDTPSSEPGMKRRSVSL